MSVVTAQNATSTTNEDNYYPGTLNGQDGWSNAWNSPTVQENVVFEGHTALQNQNNFGTASYKALEPETFEAGVMSMKIRIDNNTFSDNQDIFGLYKGVGETFVALFRFGNNFDNRHDALLLSIAESADVREVGQLTQGQWHKISLGWRSSDYSLRIKIDDTAWSAWFSSQTTWDSNGPLGIKVALPSAAAYGNFYQDGITSFVGYDEPISNALMASSTVTDQLKQLSIKLSTTSITANLDDGQIVTATIDGIVEDPQIVPETTTTSTATTSGENQSSFGSIITNIVENVIEALTGGTDATSTDVQPDDLSDPESTESFAAPVTPPAAIEETLHHEAVTTTF